MVPRSCRRRSARCCRCAGRLHVGAELPQLRRHLILQVEVTIRKAEPTDMPMMSARTVRTAGLPQVKDFNRIVVYIFVNPLTS